MKVFGTVCLIIFMSCSNNHHIQIIIDGATDTPFKFTAENRIKIGTIHLRTRRNIKEYTKTELWNIVQHPYVEIIDLYNNEVIVDSSYICHKYGIFLVRLNDMLNRKDRSALLLTNGGKCEYLNQSRLSSYDELLHIIKNYFRRNPDIDERLLPIYINRASAVFLKDRAYFVQGGIWRSWFDNEDAVSKEYSKYMDF